MIQPLDLTKLQGIVVDKIFYRKETGFGVVRIDPEGQGRSFIASGVMGDLDQGDRISLEGFWNDHPQYGKQFKVKSLEQKLPDTLEGIERFLGSGLIPGVGPKFAEKIVSQFGQDTLDVLEHHPEKLREVKGLGEKKRESIQEVWRKKEKSRELMLFLAEFGIGFNLGLKIQKVYGDRAIPMLKNNPYQLITQVKGVGFPTADRIALRLGMDPESEHRGRACLNHNLRVFEEEGHCYARREELLGRTKHLIGVDVSKIEEQLNQMLRTNELIQINDGIQHFHMHQLEREVASEVLRRVQSPSVISVYDSTIAKSFSGVSLSDEQFSAMELLLSHALSILTGGPGVGKTTLLKVLTEVLHKSGYSPILAAPTGRAAQRMEETTGRQAFTMHRLLKFSPGGEQQFIHNEEFPLKGDVFIIDEFSMVDVMLFHGFLKALPARCQVILVGDKDQLPSVGPGRLLADLLNSGAVPSVCLDKVFRQAAGSLLVRNSHRILKREMPIEENDKSKSDFYFIEANGQQKTLKVMERLLKERIPSRFGSEGSKGTQVLSPMKRGALGTLSLNETLQDWLNPYGERIVMGEVEYRVGDRVIQLTNNYDLELYNGDMGRVTGVSNEGLQVAYGQKEIVYPPDTLHDISLAYACTVHKAQGSEYPIVIMPIAPAHRIMLSIELLYTALTRAKSCCIWIGQREYLSSLLDHPVDCKRYTFLENLLKEELFL